MSTIDSLIEEEIEEHRESIEKRNEVIATLKRENEMLAQNCGVLMGLNKTPLKKDRYTEDQQEKPPRNDYVERQALKDTVSKGDE